MATPAAITFYEAHRKLFDMATAIFIYAQKGVNHEEFSESMLRRLFIDDSSNHDATTERRIEIAFAGQHATFFELIYCKNLDLLESYLCDAIDWAFHQRPERLPSDKKIEFGFVRDWRSNGRNIDDLFDFMVQKETHNFIFGTWEDRRHYFRDRLNIKLLDDVALRNQIQILSARRNLYVHNKGIVNSKFLKDISDTGLKAQLGDHLACTGADFLDNWHRIQDVVAQLDPLIERGNMIAQPASSTIGSEHA